MKKVVNVVVVSLALLFVLTGCEKKGVVNAKYEAWFYKEQAKLKEIRAKGKAIPKKVEEVKTTITETSPIEPTTSSAVVDIPSTSVEQVIATSEVLTILLPTPILAE